MPYAVSQVLHECSITPLLSCLLLSLALKTLYAYEGTVCRYVVFAYYHALLMETER